MRFAQSRQFNDHILLWLAEIRLPVRLCCSCTPPANAPRLLLAQPQQFNDQILQLFTSSLFLAGAFAALVGMVTCKKYGRRFTMIMGGLAFIIGEVFAGLLQPPLFVAEAFMHLPSMHASALIVLSLPAQRAYRFI
jgi:MFS family permease